AVETKDRTVDVRLLQQHAGVVREITRREIVGAVHHDVVRPDQIEGVFARDAGVVQDDFDVRVDAVDGFLRRLRLGPADVGVRVQDLALEIRVIDAVEIDDAEFADAGGGEIHGNGRAESAGADAENARGADFLLAGQADLGQDQVPGVPFDFVI